MKPSRLHRLGTDLASTMAGVPKHPHDDDKHSRHAADLSEHARRLGFSADNMDPSADPRQDFYRFAAGGWLDAVEIPETDSQVSGFVGLFHRVNDQILALLQNAADESGGEPQGSVAQQVGDFFASAMDTDRLEALGFAPLQPDLDRIEAIADRSGLAATVAHQLGATGEPALLVAAVAPDRKQSDLNTFQIFPGGLSLPNRDYYLQEAFEPIKAAFGEHVAEMLQQSGIGRDEAARQAQVVIAVETAMAEAMLSPVEKANPEAQYHPMPFTEAKALTPHFDFDTFIVTLGLDIEGEVNVAEPEYMKALNSLLDERPLDDFKAYLRWRLIHSMSQYLSPTVAESDLEFFVKKLQGNTKLQPREKRVASQLQHNFGHPVAQLYVREHMTEETRHKVEEMVNRVKAEFKARLESNPWLDDPTRAFALDKLEQMEIHVGFPENWIDHSRVEIRRDDYLGNATHLNQFSYQRNLAKLGQPVKDDEFAFPGSTLPTDINAAYQPARNKIEISAAILQPPFFYPDLDAAVNYGAIGAVIGHEMTHGFDSIGRRFDAQGNMHDWWTPGDSEEFEALTDMLVEQFNAYEVLPDLFVNGKLTVTENTADLGGVAIAFDALRQSFDGRPTSEETDGYSPEERFFLSWAQLWMSKTRPEVLRQLNSLDPHAPSEFRVTGPLVNLDSFFETFGVQPGDRMWREVEDRAYIW